MTLPASLPLSMSQIAAELGLSLPLAIEHPWVLALAALSGVPISFSSLLGKTGSFNGNIFVNSNGNGAFPSPPFFGTTLAQLTWSLSNIQISTSGPNLPTWQGNVKLTNNTTGVSCVLAYIGAGWQANSPPSGIVQLNATDSYTLTPSN
jgi:hypothetical protein